MRPSIVLTFKIYAYQYFYFEPLYLQEMQKKIKIENCHIYKKSAISFAQGCNTDGISISNTE